MGLCTAEGKKAWLVYSPCLNSIFASRDVQFDETFFPLRATDQRVYGLYDYTIIKEMRANNQLVTLEQQAPSIASSDLWDQSIADAVLQQNFEALLPLPDAGEPEVDIETMDGGMEGFTDSMMMISERNGPPTSSAFDEAEIASMPFTKQPATSTVTSILRANKRRSASGGKRAVTRAMKLQRVEQDVNAASDARLWDE